MIFLVDLPDWDGRSLGINTANFPISSSFLSSFFISLFFSLFLPISPSLRLPPPLQKLTSLLPPKTNLPPPPTNLPTNLPQLPFLPPPRGPSLRTSRHSSFMVQVRWPDRIPALCESASE